MRTIKDLKSRLPQVGKIEWIGIRPKRRAALIPKKQISISVKEGLEGDHFSKEGGKRMVTLIQKEHLDTVSAILNKNISGAHTRRNMVISGINLNALHDAEFQLGDEVVLQGTGFCHPCSRMEENLGTGGFNAMRGHGGITAKVVRGGMIKCGEEVRFIRVNEG